MRATRFTISVLVLLGLVAPARADVAVRAAWASVGSPPVASSSLPLPDGMVGVLADEPAPPASAAGLVSSGDPGCRPSRCGEWLDPLQVDDCASGRLAPVGFAVLPGLPAAPAEPAVRELPGLPSSSSLFLSGVLTAGLWQALRKARQTQWGHLPDWYHVDAPLQVGHSVAFEPALCFALLAVCAFDAPVSADAAPAPAIPRELPSRYESQHFLLIESPRGPPLPAATLSVSS